MLAIVIIGGLMFRRTKASEPPEHPAAGGSTASSTGVDPPKQPTARSSTAFDDLVTDDLWELVVAGDSLVWSKGPVNRSIRGYEHTTLFTRPLAGGQPRILRSATPASNLAATASTLLWTEELDDDAWHRRIVAMPLKGGEPREVARTTSHQLSHVVVAWPTGALVVRDGELLLLDAEANVVKTVAKAPSDLGPKYWLRSFVRSGSRVVYSTMNGEVWSVPDGAAPTRLASRADLHAEGYVDILGATDARVLLQCVTENALVLVEKGTITPLGKEEGSLPLRACEHDGDLFYTLRTSVPGGMFRIIYRLRRDATRPEIVLRLPMSYSDIDVAGDRLLYRVDHGARSVPLAKTP